MLGERFFSTTSAKKEAVILTYTYFFSLLRQEYPPILTSGEMLSHPRVQDCYIHDSASLVVDCKSWTLGWDSLVPPSMWCYILLISAKQELVILPDTYSISAKQEAVILLDTYFISAKQNYLVLPDTYSISAKQEALILPHTYFHPSI